MKKFLMLLCSLPIILLLLYFIPFLGVCMILFRYYLYGNKKNYSFLIILLIIGIVLLLPKAVSIIISWLPSKLSIPYLTTIVSSELYMKIISYSKLLIIVSIIFMVLSYIFSNVFNIIDNGLMNYIKKEEEKDYKIKKENDLKMQEKREKAKNTHVVICPYCGADNMLTSQTGICKHCRKGLEYKGK